MKQHIESQLSGSPVWSHPSFQHPHDGLLAAIRQAEPAVQRLMAEHLLELLREGKPQCVTGFMAAAPEVLKHVDADTVVAALPKSLDAAPEWNIGHETLEKAAAVAVAGAVQAENETALRWLEQLASSRPYRVFLLAGIAKADPQWIISNAFLLDHKQLVVLTALPLEYRESYIRNKWPWPAEQPSPLTRGFWKNVAPTEAVRLRTLMWPDVPHPICTLAIGNEDAPDDPIGAERMEIFVDGQIRYLRSKAVQTWTKAAYFHESEVHPFLQEVESAHPVAVPATQIPPGATLADLTLGCKSVRMNWLAQNVPEPIQSLRNRLNTSLPLLRASAKANDGSNA